MPFPIDENVVYSYSKEIETEKRAASRAASLLQASNVAVHAFGFDDPHCACKSLRCIGAAHKQYLRKKMLRSRSALLVIMVLFFEILACQCHDLFTKVVAGFVCMCIYGRFRREI